MGMLAGVIMDLALEQLHLSQYSLWNRLLSVLTFAFGTQVSTGINILELITIQETVQL